MAQNSTLFIANLSASMSTLSIVEPLRFTSFVATSTIKKAFSDRPILTGTCAEPRFASFSGQDGVVTEVPMVGCSPSFSDCCLPGIDVLMQPVLKACPAEYVTISSGCCPSGWDVYTEGLDGFQTPCYTSASVTYVPTIGNEEAPPSSTPSIINENVFTLRYDLAPPNTGHKLSAGAIAGIAVGSSFAVLITALSVLFFIHQRRKGRNPTISPTKPSGREQGISEPASKPRTQGPTNAQATAATPFPNALQRTGPYPVRHELANPYEGGGSVWYRMPNSPIVPAVSPMSPLFPATSEKASRSTQNNRDSGQSFLRDSTQQASAPAVEMLGDTFLHAHHPAFANLHDDEKEEDREVNDAKQIHDIVPEGGPSTDVQIDPGEPTNENQRNGHASEKGATLTLEDRATRDNQASMAAPEGHDHNSKRASVMSSGERSFIIDVGIDDGGGAVSPRHPRTQSEQDRSD